VAPQDILYLDDRAENVEAAARLGITLYCLTLSKTLHQESKADSTSLSRVMAAVAIKFNTAQQIEARIGWNSD